jgi:uncharacterized protein (TIGR03663 family)
MNGRSVRSILPAFLLGGVAVAILLLRFWDIGARTIHIDEGVSFRYGEMLLDGTWRYNPANSHGPVFFYLAAGIVRLFGLDIAAGRAAMAAVSLLWLALLLKLYWPLLRAPGRIVLAAGLGLSSGMVFFARYFIPENLFLLATVGALWAGERWIRSRDPFAPALFVILCGLMYAVKETALLTVTAGGLAAILLMLDERRQAPLMEMNWRSVAQGAVIAVCVHILLFTLFLQDPNGIPNSVLAVVDWSARASAMHVKNFPYFFELLAIHEFPLVLGALALGWQLKRNNLWTPRLAFFALWALLITIAYSLFPYKTPWCIPNMILPLGLFAAFAFDAIWKTLPAWEKDYWIVGALFLLVSGTFVAWQDSVIHPNRVLPLDYAYLQSDQSLERMIQTLKDLNTLYDGRKPMPIQTIGNPDELLTVLAGRYDARDATEPIQPGLPVYINYYHDADDTLNNLNAASDKHYIRSTYRYIRDNGTVVDLFVEEKLWNKYLTTVAHEAVQPGEQPFYDYSN